MKTLKLGLAALLTMSAGHAFAQAGTDGADANLIINELMQSNIDGLMDELNEFPDSWVELYNPTAAAIDLSQYRLGLTTDSNEAWALPKKQVGAKKRIIVYCDKVGDGLHTSFRLESGKNGSVYLFKDGQPVDSVVKMKKQPAPNIAYGRESDGSDTWGYELKPTPNAANEGGVCDNKHILGDPVFSVKGRVLKQGETLTLTLTLPEDSPEGAVIRYTTDGTEPTAKSTKATAAFSFKQSKVIRAKLFCDGWLSPYSTAQSYIFPEHETTVPVISIVTDQKYFDDAKIGIYANNTNKNNQHDWRRPVNVEFFFDNDSSVINQLCETRVAGGQSRESALKTLVVYAHKRFGTKRLAYEFFPDQRPGKTDFKSLMLRNAGNDYGYLYLRDAIIQRNMGEHTDLDWQAWRPASIYLNGHYKGLLNIRERSNEDNVYTNHDGLEDLDMIKIAQQNSQVVEELQEGDRENYDRFKAFYHEKGHSRAEYEQWMDCTEFLNLMIMNIYYNNQDFPGNNLILWRPRTENGRWRFIAKDADFGLGLYGSSSNYNTLEWLYNPRYDNDRNWANTEEATMLFRRMMENEELNREFIDRMAIYMGDFLNNQGTHAVWDPMDKMNRKELVAHRDLYNTGWGWGWGWGGGDNEQSIINEVNSVKSWLSKRTSNMYTQLGNFYKLGNLVTMTIDKGVQQKPSIVVNGVTLSDGVFDGKYYVGRDITLEGIGTGDTEVTGWKVITKKSGSTSTKTYDGPTLAFTMPQCTSLAITAICGGDGTGITAPASQRMADDNWYTLDGRRLSGEPARKGIYIYKGKVVRR